MEMILTDEKDSRFIELSKQLDKGYFEIHGEKVLKYREYNSLKEPHLVVILLDNNVAVACGSFRQLSDRAVEIKRVFVNDKYRGQGIASEIIQKLESVASQKGFNQSYLVTGKQNTAAIGLYRKLGYEFSENTGFFADDEICITMKKQLTHL